jgi:hypothetical protein
MKPIFSRRSLLKATGKTASVANLKFPFHARDR